MDYSNLEKNSSYTFKDKGWLIQALTHSSFAHDNHEKSYENLEFLGDSLLGFLVAEYLCDYFTFDEGLLSRVRAKLVSTEYLFNVAQSLHIGDYILLGASMKKSQLSKKILADMIESLIAAIYKDGGLQESKKFIYDHIILNHKNVENLYHNCFDYKTLLQEKVQQNGVNTISYETTNTTGKDNERTFEVCLKIDGKVMAMAYGKTKREAEQSCAKIVYGNMK